MDSIALVSERVRCRPVRELREADDPRFTAAQWQLPPHRLATGCQSDHLLIYRTDGVVTATKSVGRKTIRKQAVTDVVTIIPCHEEARYGLEDAGSYLQIYVAPELLRQFCEQNSIAAPDVALSPLFAEHDAWLSGYFRMLGAELDVHAEPGPLLDRLLLGQARELLLCHLVRRHAALRPGARQTMQHPSGALRPHLVRRVVEFVESRMATSISLAELAALAHLSPRHFIRAFRAATDRTPYHYVLEQRLRAAARMLRDDGDATIAQIASRTGFRSQAHFTARFRERYALPPARFRRAATKQPFPSSNALSKNRGAAR